MSDVTKLRWSKVPVSWMLAWTQPSNVAILLGNPGKMFWDPSGQLEVRRFWGWVSKTEIPNSGDFVLNNPMTEGGLRTTHSWNTIFHNSAFWEARSPFPWSTAVFFFEVLAYGICIQGRTRIYQSISELILACSTVGVSPQGFFVAVSIPIPTFPTISSWIFGIFQDQIASTVRSKN